MLQTIARLKGETVPTTAQAEQTILGNVQRANAGLKPTDKGLKALQDYIAANYADGKPPRGIAEALELATKGGINDMGIATRVQADVQARRAAGAQPMEDIQAAQRDTQLATGLGGGADNMVTAFDADHDKSTLAYGADMPGYLAQVMDTPVKVAQAQDAERLGPTGLGAMGPLLSLTGAAFGLPALTMLAGAAQSPDSPLSLLSVVGGAAQAGAFDNLSNLFGSRDIVNPDALGLTGDNLALPGLTNAPAATPVAGYGAGGLGLTGANLALPGLVNATPAVPVTGYGPSAVGGDPASLYQPESLQPGGNDLQSPGASTLLGGIQAPRAPNTTLVTGPQEARPAAVATGQGARGAQYGVTSMGFGGDTRRGGRADFARQLGRNTLLGG